MRNRTAKTPAHGPMGCGRPKQCLAHTATLYKWFHHWWNAPDTPLDSRLSSNQAIKQSRHHTKPFQAMKGKTRFLDGDANDDIEITSHMEGFLCDGRET